MKTLLMFALAGACAASAPAHDGHADTPLAPLADAPERLADGSVMLPKPSQRQLAIRTMLTRIDSLRFTPKGI